MTIMKVNFKLMSKILPRLYVIVFLAGGYAGLIGAFGGDVGRWPLLGDSSILNTMAFPAYGVLLGMIWLGVGPLIALFFVGLKDGVALKAYLIGGGNIYFDEAYIAGEIGASLLRLGIGLMESLSLLYASVSGMYLATYLIGLYRYGIGVEETHKNNFSRKALVSLFLAVIAVGLRITLY